MRPKQMIQSTEKDILKVKAALVERERRHAEKIKEIVKANEHELDMMSRKLVKLEELLVTLKELNGETPKPQEAPDGE